MTQKSRRKVLKGLAVTLPAVWIPPVVERVVLPAHAGLSGCQGVASGCYSYSTNPDRSLLWDGGTGPHNTDVYSDTNCNDFFFSGDVVVAETDDEAKSKLKCSDEVIKIFSINGCSFWECIDN